MFTCCGMADKCEHTEQECWCKCWQLTSELYKWTQHMHKCTRYLYKSVHICTLAKAYKRIKIILATLNLAV